MGNLDECQIPNLVKIADGDAILDPQPWDKRLKRALAKPWNYHVKPRVKKYLGWYDRWCTKTAQNPGRLSSARGDRSMNNLKTGDLVRVKSREGIEATLDRWKETKGCGFLEYMWQYCGTTHRVLKVMERFLDERDYRVKTCKGIVLLENVICNGTPVFGRCDRCCHLFWREEWLEKIDQHPAEPSRA